MQTNKVIQSIESFGQQINSFIELINETRKHWQTGNYLVELKIALEKEDAAAEQAAKMQPFIRQQAFLDFAQEYCETETEHSDTED